MTTVAFPPRLAGKVLDDALAAGIDAVRALDKSRDGWQSMDEEEAAAEAAIRPFMAQLTGNAEMVDLLTAALSDRACASRDISLAGEW